jgi:hypothetical protein
MRYTEDNIKFLAQNEIAVFGSNNLGMHAGGFARYCCDNFGAINGQPIGLQGDCYGIITTSFNEQPVTEIFIKHQIEMLYHFAETRPDLTFLMTKIGCGIAGYSIETIADMFSDFPKIKNIILPKEFCN